MKLGALIFQQIILATVHSRLRKHSQCKSGLPSACTVRHITYQAHKDQVRLFLHLDKRYYSKVVLRNSSWWWLLLFLHSTWAKECGYLLRYFWESLASSSQPHGSPKCIGNTCEVWCQMIFYSSISRKSFIEGSTPVYPSHRTAHLPHQKPLY